jgi:predicted NAD/FAD-dependent oxidoreductase
LALTIHARAEFSRHHLESPKEDVAKALFAAAEPWITGTVTAWQLHRWRYSRPVAANYPGYLCSEQPARVAFASDGLGGPNVEGAFLSGLSAAKWIAGAT